MWLADLAERLHKWNRNWRNQKKKKLFLELQSQNSILSSSMARSSSVFISLCTCLLLTIDSFGALLDSSHGLMRICCCDALFMMLYHKSWTVTWWCFSSWLTVWSFCLFNISIQSISQHAFSSTSSAGLVLSDFDISYTICGTAVWLNYWHASIWCFFRTVVLDLNHK